MVLNLAGGTEPCKFYTCIHRTLRGWKNKMSVMTLIYFTFIAQNLLPPKPWNWLTKPLGFDRTTGSPVKNHWVTVTLGETMTWEDFWKIMREYLAKIYWNMRWKIHFMARSWNEIWENWRFQNPPIIYYRCNLSDKRFLPRFIIEPSIFLVPSIG